MKTIFEMMENFIGRGMNVRVDFVGGTPMFSATLLEERAGAEAGEAQSRSKNTATAYCM